jgi:hypothetical protein
MQGDLEASPAGTTDLGTTADPAPALSEPTGTVDGSVEGQSEQPTDDTSLAPGTDDASNEPEGGEAEDDAPRSEEEQKLSRSERRKLREQERIAAAIEADRVERARQAEEAAAAKKRADEAAKAAKARTERLSQFIGTPDAPDKPGTISTLQAENAELYERLRTEIGTIDQDTFDQIDTKIKANKARIERLNENRAMSSEIEAFVWDTFGADFASAVGFPEMADPATKAKYLNAEGGVRGALNVLADAIRTAKDAERDAALKAQAEKHATQVKALEADLTSWRIRAGGSEVADTTSGGTASLSGQLLTPERYRSMTFEQRQKLRSTPEGRAQIDAMTNRAGVA